MQEDTRKLLQECNSGCKMAINSMQQIQDYITSEGLSTLIRESTERHEELEAESARLLEENGEYEKEHPAMLAADFIAAMTDDYFIELYHKMFPENGHRIKHRSYFAE